VKLLHVLFSLRSEGSPRLALELCREHLARGDAATVVPLVAEPTPMKDLFLDAGVEVAPALGWTGRDYVRLRRRARDFVGVGGFDGVICYALGAHISVASGAGAVPTVVHIGNAPPSEPGIRRKIAWQLKIGNRFVHRHVACSDHVRDRVLADYRLPKAAVVSIPNGIRLEHFDSVREDRRAPGAGDQPRVVMVGSFEGHKRQEVLIRALRASIDKKDPWTLHLVGEGSREPELRQLASTLEVDGYIRWIGTVGDVRTALADADVFAYAVSDQEGLGIALVEALAAGLPVVASDVGACREVLRGGSLGTLVGRDDPDRWAAALTGAAGETPVSLAELDRYDVVRTAEGYRGLFG
jgi:glycosyltransferase involved in cell wall biosynthesis